MHDISQAGQRVELPGGHRQTRSQIRPLPQGQAEYLQRVGQDRDVFPDEVGYRGRLGIFEILPMSPDIMTAIYERTPPDQIHRDSGRPTMLQDGLRKVRAGITTLDEILRVTA